jgi:hypothetical protein
VVASLPPRVDLCKRFELPLNEDFERGEIGSKPSDKPFGPLLAFEATRYM